MFQCRVTALLYSKKNILNLRLYVTRPAKTGNVGTNYISSHNRPFLSTGTEYFCSVTSQFKCVIRVGNFMAIVGQQKNYKSTESYFFKFYAPMYPGLAGPVTYVTWSDKKGLIAPKYMCLLNSVYLHYCVSDNTSVSFSKISIKCHIQ